MANLVGQISNQFEIYCLHLQVYQKQTFAVQMYSMMQTYRASLPQNGQFYYHALTLHVVLNPNDFHYMDKSS